MTGISVVIVARDEERTIGAVLAAVRPLADEIVLVDSGSSDGTLELARQHGAQIHHQDWLGYAAQKNHAIGLARGEWVLSLDADEVVTAELAAEIRETLAGPRAGQFDGFRIPRLLYIGERAIAHGGFYPDAQLRLFRREKGRFNDRPVHERVFVEGRVADLSCPMLHYSYATVDDFAAALDKYARLSAGYYLSCGGNSWRASALNERLHPLWTFFYRYVLRAGFLDGALGLELAWLYAGYVRKKISFLRQLLSQPAPPHVAPPPVRPGERG